MYISSVNIHLITFSNTTLAERQKEHLWRVS
jgi:hypothetical protein